MVALGLSLDSSMTSLDDDAMRRRRVVGCGLGFSGTFHNSFHQNVRWSQRSYDQRNDFKVTTVPTRARRS